MKHLTPAVVLGAAALVLLHTTSTQAQETIAATAAAAEGDDAVAEVTVTASRHVPAGTTAPTGPAEYELTSRDWPDVLAGSNPLALAKNMPGITFTSTDAYGLDLSDAFIFVRGFRGNEIAYTFEGIPLNDGSYGSVTGNSVLSVGVSDEIGMVRIAPGSVRVDTFSNTANGGEMRYALVDPDAHPSASVTLGYGSHATQVESISAQPGQLGSSGPKVLLGVQRVFKDKYTGRGTQDFLRGDVKVLQDVPGGTLTAFFSVARAEVWGYNNTSFDMLAKLGWDGTDILYPDYRKAYLINLPQNASRPCGPYTCGELASIIPYDTGQRTTDMIGNLAYRVALPAGVSAKLMGYGAGNVTDVGIADVTTPSLTGAPFSELVWSPRSKRFGGTLDLTFAAGSHTLSAGAWLEHGTSSSIFSWYNEPVLGQGDPLKTIGPYDRYGPAFQTANDSRWRTDSRQAYLQDTFKPSDTLTLTAGFKSLRFVTAGGGVGPDLAPNGRLEAANPFLPHATLEWRAAANSSYYLDAGGTTIGYRVSSRGNIGPVSSAWAATDQATFEAAARTIRPEKDWNFTAGAYHGFGAVSVNVDAYYSLVLNRLVNGSSGPQFAPIRTVGIVPRSRIVGSDLTVAADPTSWRHLSQSASISRFVYEDDLTIPGAEVFLRGKSQPGYPAKSFISEVAVRASGLEAGLTSTEYLDQPFTYSNDIYVPNYWMMNAYAACRTARSGAFPDFLLRLDVNNLLDRHNIGSTGIGGFSVSGDYQTFMRAAPRQLLFTVSASY